jgi:hypothetical protein
MGGQHTSCRRGATSSNVPAGAVGVAAGGTVGTLAVGLVNEHEGGLLATLAMISTLIVIHADARGADHSERFGCLKWLLGVRKVRGWREMWSSSRAFIPEPPVVYHVRLWLSELMEKRP